MKSYLKKIILIFLGLILLLIFSMSIYHQIMLKKELPLIIPKGELISVKGHDINVYVEGEKRNKPIMIIMSGSGVAAPVYDYKVLYSKLSEDYRIVVIEKAGYGYSEVAGVSRQIDNILLETREALKKAGEEGPYILLAHSMSGLEALFWAQNYPEEVASIIGLDMALPKHYENMENKTLTMNILKLSTYIGIQRIPIFNPISNLSLSEDEFKQHKYLSYRNTLNEDVFEEYKNVFENAIEVGKGPTPDLPILFFLSNGEGTGFNSDWVKYGRNLAERSNKIQLVELDCGHNIHYFQSELIAKTIKDFLSEISANGV